MFVTTLAPISYDPSSKDPNRDKLRVAAFAPSREHLGSIDCLNIPAPAPFSGPIFSAGSRFLGEFLEPVPPGPLERTLAALLDLLARVDYNARVARRMPVVSLDAAAYQMSVEFVRAKDSASCSIPGEVSFGEPIRVWLRRSGRRNPGPTAYASTSQENCR